MHRWLSTVCLPLLLLLLLISGCVTHKLWSESTLDEWNEPASPPNLRLFRDAPRDDFLVRYDEYSDRDCTTQARAFFLRLNTRALERNRRPHFVSPNLSAQLPPVPVFAHAPTNVPPSLYALTGTNGVGFSIFSGRRETGPYALPFYNDGVGRLERIAWTPLTVTADLTIIGGVAAIVVWTGLAESHTTISVR